jgi:hypothetical protein
MLRRRREFNHFGTHGTYIIPLSHSMPFPGPILDLQTRSNHIGYKDHTGSNIMMSIFGAVISSNAPRKITKYFNQNFKSLEKDSNAVHPE